MKIPATPVNAVVEKAAWNLNSGFHRNDLLWLSLAFIKILPGKKNHFAYAKSKKNTQEATCDSQRLAGQLW